MKRSTLKEFIRPLVKRIIREALAHKSYKDASKLPKGGAVAMDNENIAATVSDIIGRKYGMYPRVIYDWMILHAIDPHKLVKTLGVKINDDFISAVIHNEPFTVKEASSTAGGAAGPYQTPYAFVPTFDKKHKTIATQLGYEETNADTDKEDKEQARVNKNKMRREWFGKGTGQRTPISKADLDKAKVELFQMLDKEREHWLKTADPKKEYEKYLAWKTNHGDPKIPPKTFEEWKKIYFTNESVIPSIMDTKRPFEIKTKKFRADGDIVADKATIIKAVIWMGKNKYTYTTLEELMRDYFLTFPNEFDTDGFELN